MQIYSFGQSDRPAQNNIIHVPHFYHHIINMKEEIYRFIGALQSFFYILYDFNLHVVNSLIPKNTYSIMYIFYTSRWYWSISDSTCTSESVCWECESSEAMIYTGR